MRLRLAAALAATVLVVLALGSDHLNGADGLLVASTLTGALLTGGLAVQPLLVLGRRRIREHRVLGIGLVALAAGHVGALFLLAPDDALFAMSPDGPTRARMALIAIVALLLAATLAAVGPRTRWDRRTWRLLHAYLGLVVVVVLGVGHAVLTDGALEGAGTRCCWVSERSAGRHRAAVGRDALSRR